MNIDDGIIKNNNEISVVDVVILLLFLLPIPLYNKNYGLAKDKCAYIFSFTSPISLIKY